MTLYADIAGERLDAFLARCVPELTRSAAQKLLEEGCVLRNGKPGRTSGHCGAVIRKQSCCSPAAPARPVYRKFPD